jgi:hypothetical protein
VPEERPFNPHLQPEIDPAFQRAAWVLWGVVFLMAISTCIGLVRGCEMVTGLGQHEPPSEIGGLDGSPDVASWMRRAGYEGQFQYVEGSVERAFKDSSRWYHVRLTAPADVALLRDAVMRHWRKDAVPDTESSRSRADAPPWWPRHTYALERLKLFEEGSVSWRLVLDPKDADVYLEDVGHWTPTSPPPASPRP